MGNLGNGQEQQDVHYWFMIYTGSMIITCYCKVRSYYK